MSKGHQISPSTGQERPILVLSAVLWPVGEIEITADNRGVINPTAEELSMGQLLREGHSSVEHKELPKRRLDAIEGPLVVTAAVTARMESTGT